MKLLYLTLGLILSYFLLKFLSDIGYYVALTAILVLGGKSGVGYFTTRRQIDEITVGEVTENIEEIVDIKQIKADAIQLGQMVFLKKSEFILFKNRKD